MALKASQKCVLILSVIVTTEKAGQVKPREANTSWKFSPEETQPDPLRSQVVWRTLTKQALSSMLDRGLSSGE